MSANEIRIEEMTGANRAVVVLRNRGMPYRGMSTPGTQRVVTTWYQGNPKATQQIMGPTKEPTTLEGTWKSKFLRVGLVGTSKALDVELDNLPEVLAVANGQVLEQPAALVVSIFERLMQRGRELRFSWGTIVRYGILTEFTPIWDRLEDVRWSATFTWNGETERSPRSGTTSTVGQPVQTALATADNELVAMPRVVVPTAGNDVLASMASLRSRSLDFLAYARQAVAAVTIPLRVVQGAAATVSEMKSAAGDVALDTLGIVYESFTTFDTVIEVFSAEDWRRSVGLQAENVATRAVDERERLAQLSIGQKSAIQVRVRVRTSLRRLAAQYYGSEQDWPLIAEANGINGSEVEVGTLLLIPVQSVGTEASGGSIG